MSQNGNDKQDDIQKYQLAWVDMMDKIWQDRLELYHVRRTGNLRNSIRSDIQFAQNDLSSTIQFDFAKYGVYVEAGTGNHYVHDNGGDLEFLDPVYRAEHRLDRKKKVGPKWGGYVQSGQPRSKKPWLTPSWSISRRVLGNTMVHIIGEKFLGMADDLL